MPSQTLTLATVLDSSGTLPDNFVTGPDIASGSITGRHISNGTVTTDYIFEGLSNLYYTDNRARAALSVTGAATYDEANGIISVGAVTISSTNVIEGANIFFTNARARSAIYAFDPSIDYNPSTGAISANLYNIYPGGPNVITVNGQKGHVVLTTANLQEQGNLFFTNERVHAAFSYGDGLIFDSGTLYVGQSLTTASNVEFNAVRTSVIDLFDPANNESNGVVFYNAETLEIQFDSNLTPTVSSTFFLGTDQLFWDEIFVNRVNTNTIVSATSVTAPTFYGDLSGEIITNITVSSDLNSIIIDEGSNPPLYIPKGTRVIFDVSSDQLNGIGFDIGVDTDPIGTSNTLVGITFTVEGEVVEREDYLASFNGSNTRILTFTVPQSIPTNLIYYAPEYPSWRAKIAVAPPADTDELVEGITNFFFTDARLYSGLATVADANVGLYFDEVLNLLSLEQDLTPNGTPTFTSVTATLGYYGNVFGNVYGTFFGTIDNLDDFTTSNLLEGNNFYFTDARARQSLSAVDGIIYSSITGEFFLNTDYVIRTIETTTISNLTIASNIVVGDTVNTQSVQAISLSGNLTGTVTGNVIGTVSSLDNHTTANLIEGANLYFTNARVWSNVSPHLDTVNARIDAIVSGTALDTGNVAEGANLYYTDARVWANVTSGNLTTSYVPEGSNLYFTNARVWANVDPHLNSINSRIDAIITGSAITTSNVAEGANLYFTNARVWANVYPHLDTVNARIDAIITGDAVTTSNVAEGANLYFTNDRVWANVYPEFGNLDARLDILEAYTTSNVAEGANLYFTNARVWANVDPHLTAVNARIDAIITGDAVTTSNVAEGANLYFTNTRVWSNVYPHLDTVNTRIDAIVTGSTITTSNVPEGANLYFSNARARAAVGNSTGVYYNESTGVFSIGQDVGINSSIQLKDLVLSGNLSVTGISTTINAREVAISDNMIYLNEAISKAIANAVGDGANVTYTLVENHDYLVGEVVRVTGITPNTFNQSSYTSIIAVTSNSLTIVKSTVDTYVSGGNVFVKVAVNPDLGISGGYNDGTYHHTGVFRDATDGIWKFFDSYTPEPDANIYIDTTHPSFRLANVAAKEFIGPVTGNVSTLDNHTTTNLIEGANLYYTNVRVWSNVSPHLDAVNTRLDAIVTGSVVTTSNVPEGANLYFTNVRVWDNVTASITTSYVPEGSNLYFTNARVWDNVTASITTSYVPEGSNLYYTNVRVWDNIISGISTTYVPEGSNLYYTNARVWANVSPELGNLDARLSNVEGGVAGYSNSNVKSYLAVFDGNIIPTQNNIYDLGSPNAYWRSIYVGDGTIFFSGGASIEISPSGTLEYKADGGITIPLATATEGPILAPATGGTVNLTAELLSNVVNYTTANIIEGSNLYYTNARVWANVYPHLDTVNTRIDSIVTGGTVSTSNIPEGSNLYYTDARVWANVATGNLTTTYVPEGANLYFTNVRVWSNVYPHLDTVNARIDAIVTGSAVTTSNVAEGANLYFTNARVWANVYPHLDTVNARIDAILTSGTLTTSNVPEGANLYFTNTRAVTALGGQQVGTGNSVTFANVSISDYVNLSTKGLRFPADAYGGSGDTATITLTTSGGEATRMTFTMTNDADDQFNFVAPSNDGLLMNGNKVWHAGNDGAGSGLDADLFDGQDSSYYLSSNNLVEGANLFFTNARVWANVASGNLTTSYVPEGANLYFTNARSRAAISNVAGVSYVEATGVISLTNTGVVAGSYGNANVIPVITVDSQGRITSVSNVSAAGGAGAVSSVNDQTGTVVLTTANIAESGNLYFTNARVWANIYPHLDTVNARIDAIVTGSAITTSNVPEGANLYFTNARTRAAVGTATPTTLIYYEANGNFAVNVEAINYVTSVNGLTGALTLTTTNIAEGSNLYYTNARVWSNVASGSLTTSYVPEGANLYYTNARARAAISNSTGVFYNTSTGVLSIGQDVSTTANVTFSNVTVTGNLSVLGNAVQFETNTLVISDPLIQLGKNPVGDAVDLGFFGHYVGGSPSVERHAGLFRDATDGQFKLFTNLDPEPVNIVDTANSTYTNANLVVGHVIGNVDGFVSTLGNHTTSGLAEGSNLYYTNVRVWANISPHLTAVNARIDAIITGSAITTSNVPEGANLYFTNARSRAAISNVAGVSYVESTGVLSLTDTGVVAGHYGNASLIPAFTVDSQGRITSVSNVSAAGGAGAVSSVNDQTGVVVLTTANIAESGNLYFTNARVWANVASGSLTTSYVPEGANLYFTNARSRAAVGSATPTTLIYYEANGNFAVNVEAINYVTSVNGQTGVVTLTTANIAEGANLYFTNVRVWSNVYPHLDTVNARIDAIVTGSSITTSNVPEGANLYFTNARVWSNVTAGLTTTYVPEGANLYFTNARSRSAISAGSGISYDSGTGIISSTGSGTSVQIDRYQYTATGVQTAFTGPDDNTNTLNIDPTIAVVFLNGVLLNYTDDYTANTDTVTLTESTIANDVLVVINPLVIISGPTIRTTPVVVSNLPNATVSGMGSRAFVSDATSTTFASIVAGGGSNKVPVYSDGTDWLIG